jgi:DNA repair protein SbcC/Rad50
LEECQRTLADKQRASTDAQRLADQVEARRFTAQAAERALQQRRQLIDIQKQLAIADAKLQAIRGRFTEAETAVVQSRETLNALETAWLTGQAALLAQQLMPGTPCPVCGATEHPTPARSDHDLPTESAVSQRRNEVKQLEVARDSIREEEIEQQRIVVRWQSDVRSLEESLGELSQADVALLTTRVNDTRTSLVQAEQVLVQVPVLTQDIAQLQEEEVSIKALLSATEEKLREATSMHAGAQAVLRDRAGDIPEHLRTHKALEQAKEQAADKVRLLKQALDTAHQKAGEAREAVVACETALKLPWIWPNSPSTAWRPCDPHLLDVCMQLISPMTWSSRRLSAAPLKLII